MDRCGRSNSGALLFLQKYIVLIFRRNKWGPEFVELTLFGFETLFKSPAVFVSSGCPESAATPK